LLHDATDLATNHDAVAKTEQTLQDIQHLETNEIETVQKASQALALYRQQFAQAVALAERPGQTSTDRVQSVVRDYERDLDNLLKHSGRFSREHLMEELRQRVNSFDTRISKTTEETNPDMQRVTQDLQISSDQVLRKTSELESVNWTRVKDDHADARKLLHQAEWALSIVSALTLLVSIWVSYTLPRQVIRPLLSLKEAVDHAAQGNFEIDFDVHGKGEIVDLVESLQRMLTSIRSKVSTARNIRVS
jgi:nitrogen fixation/metabolism regulation signal transduction histidine kinase